MGELSQKLSEESLRIQEDTIYSAKSHFNAADRWSKYHMLIGMPSAVIAAIAGGSAFNEMPLVAGSLAMISTALITVLTFLKPSERSEAHRVVGGQYLKLRNQARMFNEITLIECSDVDAAKEQLLGLANTRDELNQTSPAFTQKDYERAKSEIDQGRTIYQIDKDKNDCK